MADAKDVNTFFGNIFIILLIIAVGGGLAYWRWDAGAAARANNRAVTLIGLNQHKEALELIDDTLRRNPDVGKLHLNRGMALQNLGRFQEAWQAYEKAMTLDVTTATRARQGMAEIREHVEKSRR